MRLLIDLWEGIRGVGRVFVDRWRQREFEALVAENHRQLDALLDAVRQAPKRAPMAPYLTPEQEAMLRTAQQPGDDA